MDRKENPFDQFDSASPNPFDQFDEAPVAKAANPFDQFDEPVKKAEPSFLDRAKTAVTDFFAPEQPAQAPKAAPQQPRKPSDVAEMTPYEPSLWDKLLDLAPGNRGAAYAEFQARRIAKEQNIPVNEAYRQIKEGLGVRGIAGSRPSGQPMWNPEGRAPIRTAVEAVPYVAEGVLDVPKGVAESALRAYRAGNIENAVDKDFVGQMITYLGDDSKDVFIPNIPKKLGMDPKDPNYQPLMGLGNSLGYSLTTMVSSAVAAAGASPLGPLASVGAGMTTAGTVAYRASKDEFLDRVRDKLNKDSKRVFQRPLSDAEWQKAKGKFESAATEYGAWEAIPEAISNAIFLKAFSAPAATAKGARLANAIEKAASLASENITETVTGLGQNTAELKAGLTQDELTVVDAFNQQFLQTMATMGVMAGTMKAKQMATDFYNDRVLPKIDPGSALAKAIEADLKNYSGYTPGAFRSRSSREAMEASQRAEDQSRAAAAPPEPPQAEPPKAEPASRVEPFVGEEPPAPAPAPAPTEGIPGIVSAAETIPESAADLTEEEQNLVTGYLATGFSEEEALDGS